MRTIQGKAAVQTSRIIFAEVKYLFQKGSLWALPLQHFTLFMFLLPIFLWLQVSIYLHKD